MKLLFRKTLLYWLVVSLVFLNSQFAYTKTVVITDDDAKPHVVDPTTRVTFREDRPRVGDTFKSDNKSFEIVKEFKVNNKSYFLYNEIEHHDTNSQKTLIDPNGEGGKALLDSARQLGSGSDTKLDFSNGAPKTSYFSNQELVNIYHRRGNANEPGDADMNQMRKAAYNTEMRFYNNYFNSLVNQSNKEVGDTKSELENYDTNSKAFSNSPATDSHPDLVNIQLDNKPYISSHASELNQLRDRLNSSISKSPQQWNAKIEASKTLRETDNAYLSDLKELGDILLETSKVLVDIATDVIPFTSIPKDAYRLLIGKDPLTGEALSSFERALSGAFMAGAIFTLGATNTLKLEAKTVKVIARATEDEGKLVEGIVKAFDESAAKLGAKTGEAIKDFAQTAKEFLGNEIGAVGKLDNLADSAKKLGNVKWGVWGDLPKVTQEGKDFAKIGDRLYTKHAVDRMVPSGFGTSAGVGGVSGRGIPPMVVETVIANGTKVSEQIVDGVARQTWKMGTVQVITENNGNLIVTVMRVGQ